MVLNPRGRYVAGGTGIPASPFVRRQGARLTRNGQYFRFVGANIANAAGSGPVGGERQCGPSIADTADLRGRFRRLAETGATVARVSCYRGYVYGNGATADWTGLDRCVAAAEEYGLKLICTLEDHWGHCFGDTAKSATWYATTYAGTPDDGYPVNYRAHVANVVGRYASRTGIMAWECINEPQSSSATVLLPFMADICAFIKSLDPNHLVAPGVAGLGDAGVGVATYRAIHALASVDLLTSHRYDTNNGENNNALEGVPLREVSPLDLQLFTQDNGYTFVGYGYGQALARRWQTLTGVVATGTAPYQQSGIVLGGGGRASADLFVGDVYIDEFRVGTRTDTYEAVAIGTTPTGLQFGDRVTAATVQASPVGAKGDRCLRVTLGPQGAGSADGYVRTGPDAAIVAGAAISARLWVDNAAPTVLSDDSVAATLWLGRALAKPAYIGETGMTILAATGHETETRASRATKLERKIAAFLGAGGAGVLVWTWTPDEADDQNIYGGDPLVAALQRQAAAL